MHFITILLTLLGFTIDNTPAIKTASNDLSIVETTVSGIGFGKKKKGCDGKGVCIITNDIASWDISDMQSIATIKFTSSGSVSSFHFSYEDLTKNAIKRYFSSDHFIVGETFETKLEVGKSTYKIRIPEGKYPLQETKDGFLLEVSG